MFAERLAGFRQKTRPKKWQGGHLLGAFRHSAFAPAASLAPMRSLSPVAASGVAPIPAVLAPQKQMSDKQHQRFTQQSFQRGASDVNRKTRRKNRKAKKRANGKTNHRRKNQQLVLVPLLIIRIWKPAKLNNVPNQKKQRHRRHYYE